MFLSPADIEYYVKERLHPEIFKSLVQSSQDIYCPSDILNNRVVHITTAPDSTFIALNSQYIPNIVQPEFAEVKTDDDKTVKIKYYPPVTIEDYIENHVLQQNRLEYPILALDLRCRQVATKTDDRIELFLKHMNTVESYLDELIYTSLVCSKVISSTSILGVAVVENEDISQYLINNEEVEAYLDLLEYIKQNLKQSATKLNPELPLLKLLKKYGAIIDNHIDDSIDEEEARKLMLSYKFFTKRLLKHQFVSISYENSFYLTNYIISRYNRVLYRFPGDDKLHITNISELPTVYERNEGNIELLVLSGDHMIEWRQPADVYFIEEEFIFDKVYMVNVFNPNILFLALFAAINKLGLADKFGGFKTAIPRFSFINPIGNQFIKTMTIPVDKFIRVK